MCLTKILFIFEYGNELINTIQNVWTPHQGIAIQIG